MKRYWHVMCDNCGAVFPHEFVDDREKALEVLTVNGWSGAGGEDFCPSCSGNA